MTGFLLQIAITKCYSNCLDFESPLRK